MREFHALRQYLIRLAGKDSAPVSAHVESEGRGVLIHRDFKPLLVDREWAAMHGYTPQEVLSIATILPLIAPDEQERMAKRIRTCLSDCEALPSQAYQGVRKDGSLVWLENRLTRIYGKGEPAIQMTAVEIAKPQAAAHVALEGESRYRALVEQSLVGLYIIQDSRYRYVNPKFAEIVGHTPEEITQLRHCRELIAEPDRDLVQRNVQRRLSGEVDTLKYTFKMIHKNGYDVDVEVHGTAMDFKGKRAVIGVMLDVTERKRLEAYLRQTQKIEAIGTLAGGIAHDFNNILSAILGFTELSLNEIEPEHAIRPHLQEVLAAGCRAKDLVQQILAFSRQNSSDHRPILLTPLIHETLKWLRSSLPSTIEIRTHLTAPAGTVAANPTQLQQVLLNLCNNAEHAMRLTGGVLDVQLESVHIPLEHGGRHPNLRPGAHLRLIVRDTGSGMEPEVVARIFEPFFTTKPPGEGTGMGLSVVHGIVASHQGAITVESIPGQGSTFALYLPQLDEPAVAAEALLAPELPRGSERILFVDDEEAIAFLAQSMLHHLGYQAEVYTRSDLALAAFASDPERFDLVITDQTMPSMTGESLAVAIRRIRPNVPVILCTGYSHVISSERAKALGFDAFCLKPLLTQDLSGTIRRVLGDGRVGDSCR